MHVSCLLNLDMYYFHYKYLFAVLFHIIFNIRSGTYSGSSLFVVSPEKAVVTAFSGLCWQATYGYDFSVYFFLLLINENEDTSTYTGHYTDTRLCVLHGKLRTKHQWFRCHNITKKFAFREVIGYKFKEVELDTR